MFTERWNLITLRCVVGPNEPSIGGGEAVAREEVLQNTHVVTAHALAEQTVAHVPRVPLVDGLLGNLLGRRRAAGRRPAAGGGGGPGE